MGCGDEHLFNVTQDAEITTISNNTDEAVDYKLKLTHDSQEVFSDISDLNLKNCVDGNKDITEVVIPLGCSQVANVDTIVKKESLFISGIHESNENDGLCKRLVMKTVGLDPEVARMKYLSLCVM